MTFEIPYHDERIMLCHGDATEVLGALPDASVDAVVTDPPYLLGFMGKEWDTKKAHEHTDWHSAWATECFRLLKPGGHLLTFGGTRTWHRLACAIEDAGFEIRDSIAWLYGSGFPKSLDVSKAIDKAAGAEREVVGRRTDGRYAHGFSEDAKRAQGATAHDYSAGWVGDPADITAPATDAAKQWQGYGTSLKPAFEPIIAARKPLQGNVAQNVLKHGTGAVNVDGCRVAHGDDVNLSQVQRQQQGEDNGWRRAKNMVGTEVSMYKPAGRWPTNVVLDGEMADELDAQTGTLTSGKASSEGHRRKASRDKSGGAALEGSVDGSLRNQDEAGVLYGDSGGPSRFFPVFKYQAKAPAKERPKVNGVAHPTVKPLELFRWLIRLVTPPGGTVIDPFAGSGTTGEAVLLEGFNAILIEREADYIPLILERIARQTEETVA